MNKTEDRIERYLEPHFKDIQDTSCTIVGMGTLGSKNAKNLGRIGVNLKLIDRDFVESKNLSNQGYLESDVGEFKVEAMKKKIKRIREKNKSEIESSVVDLNSNNIEREIKDTDVIIDSTDNLKTRLLLNDFAKKREIPLIIGMLGGSEGMTMTVSPNGPCFKCVLGEEPISQGTCDELGISPGIAEVISGLQIRQFIDIVKDKPVENLLTVNLENMDFNGLKLKRRENCSTCNGKYEELNRIKESRVLCDKKSVQMYPRITDLTKLKEINPNLDIYENKIGILESSDIKIMIYESGKAIVKGVESVEEARKEYDRLLGGR